MNKLLIVLLLSIMTSIAGSILITQVFFKTVDKDTFALIKCAPGEILKQSSELTWDCSQDLTSNSGGNGSDIGLIQCPKDYILKSDGNGKYICSVDEGDPNTDDGVVVIGETVTISTGNGLSVANQILSMGTASLSSTGSLRSTDFAVFYNKVSSVTANNGITNTGTANDPVLEINAGNGLAVSSNILSAIAGNNSILVDSNGIKTKIDLDGGLVVSVDGVSLRQDCGNDEILKWDGFSWDCSDDDGTAYSAGTGIQIVSDTITNTGVITITPGTGLTNSGTAQNPILAPNFGITAGTIAEGDTVVILSPGNSMRNVITPTNDTTIALTIAGHATQSVDLFQIKNSGGTSLVNVTNNGRVGIGDDTPDSELDVEGTIRTNDIITKGPIVDVRAFGAIGDGVADDTSEIAAAINSLPVDGGIIYFPTGKYLTTGIHITKSNVTFRGNGMWNTMIITDAFTNAMFEPVWQMDISNTVFEDMTINGNGEAVVGISISGNELVGTTRVSRVRFTGSDNGVLLYSANNVVIEKSIFEDPGNGSSNGIVLGQGSRNIVIRENKFRYLANGVITDTGDNFGDANEEVSEHITVENNYFDLGFYAKLPATSNSGGTVSYTDTTLTDTSANFTGIAGSGLYDLVKVMPLKEENTTGTGVTIYGNRVVDTNAQFVTAKVMQGDIIKVDNTHLAIISSIENETTLWVEEWLLETNRALVNPPLDGTAYKTYGVFLALAHARTATELTVNSWHSFDGDALEPSGGNWVNQDAEVIAPLAGTLYEYIMPNYYAINNESSARYLKIIGNTVKRTFADQISTFGYRAQITNNYVEYGMDMGITVQGEHNIITNNVIRQSGTSGIIIENGDDNTVQSNMIYGHTWRKVIYNDDNLAGISIYSGNRNYVTNNFVDGLDYYPADKGIVVVGDSVGEPSAGNIIKDNILKNHSVGGVVINGAWATGTQLFGNSGKLATLDSGVLPDTASIVSETETNATFALELMSGQTGNLQEWRTSSGDNLAQIAPNGSVQFNMQNGSTGSFLVHGATDNALYIDYANNRVGINTLGAPFAGLQIDSKSPGEFAFLVRDSGGDQRAAIDDNGNFRLMSEPADAGNVYRSSGVVSLLAQYWNGSAIEYEEFQITNSRFGIAGSNYNALSFWNAAKSFSPMVISGGDGGQVGIGFEGPTDATLASLGQLHVRSRATTTPTLTAMGANGQTASLQKWMNHLGGALAEIDASGNLKVPHIVGNTAQPGIAAGAAAGSGPVVDIIGTDLAGRLAVVTGTTTLPSAVLATVTFNTAYGAAPYVVLTPANANAAALTGGAAIYVTSTTTTFTLNSGSSNLTDSTSYEWTYHVLQ